MNTAIILAAGQGTRMNSTIAKVLHKVGNKSLPHTSNEIWTLVQVDI